MTITEDDIVYEEREFDVVDQDGDDRIGYEHSLRIKWLPSKEEAEQLKQEILWALRLKEKLDKFVQCLYDGWYMCQSIDGTFDGHSELDKDEIISLLENMLRGTDELLESTKIHPIRVEDHNPTPIESTSGKKE